MQKRWQLSLNSSGNMDSEQIKISTIGDVTTGTYRRPNLGEYVIIFEMRVDAKPDGRTEVELTYTRNSRKWKPKVPLPYTVWRVGQSRGIVELGSLSASEREDYIRRTMPRFRAEIEKRESQGSQVRDHWFHRLVSNPNFALFVGFVIILLLLFVDHLIEIRKKTPEDASDGRVWINGRHTAPDSVDYYRVLDEINRQERENSGLRP